MTNNNFDLPRPTVPVPSSSSIVANDNSKVLDYVVNSEGTVVTRTGKTIPTLDKVLSGLTLDALGYAPTPVNGGVWAYGQEFNFYNEYMIYNGEAYSPLPTTVLPYLVGAVPDLGFVYQIRLNDAYSIDWNSKNIGYNADDWKGFTEALYADAGTVDNGLPDTAIASQRLDAIKAISAKMLALKIFQAPTDGGLTEIQTRTVNANEVYEVRKNSDGSLATIYSDVAGTTEIVQNGTDNKSGSDGVVKFYIADGDYYVEVDGVKSNFTDIVKATNVETSDGRNVQERLDDLPSEVDAAGTAATLIEDHNSDAGAHPELSAFITSEADRAEIAANSAATNADIFDSTSSGVVGTAEGEQFQVLSGDGNELIRYRHDAGNVATELGRIPTSQGVDIFSKFAGFLTASESAINLDLDGGFLRIPNSNLVRARYGNSTSLLPAQDVPLPVSTASYNVVLNISTGALNIQLSSAAVTQGIAVIGQYYADTKQLAGFPPHYVNGGKPPLNQSWGAALVSVPSYFNVNTVDLMVEITGGVTRLLSAAGTFLLPESTLDIPAENTFYRIEYDPRTSAIEIKQSNAAVDPKRVPFAILQKSGSSIEVNRIDKYTIDGRIPTIKSKGYRGEIVAANNASTLNFDFNSNTLEVAAFAVRFTYEEGSTLLVAQSTAMPAKNGAWMRILADIETKIVSFKSLGDGIADTEVQVGFVNTLHGLIYNVPYYYVNGLPVSNSNTPIQSVQRNIVNGDTDASYELDAPMPAYTSIGSEMHDTIYTDYDALMAQFPTYITKTLLGLDDFGNSIYQYDFKPKPVETDGGAHATKFNKMILMSGVHGAEKAGVKTLYYTLKKIAEGWKSDSKLSALRWNVHFVVIPVSCPWGFDNNTRKNGNGVDIARNFTADWSFNPDTESPQYAGTSPLSEKESQYLDAVMAANTDAIYCGSFHNFFNGTDILWNAGATKFGLGLAKAWVSRISQTWKARYNWLPQDDDSYMGYASFTSPPGSEGKQATLTYGIQGGTIEVNRQIEAAPDPAPYTEIAATMATEAFINWLLLNLSEASKLYNERL